MNHAGRMAAPRYTFDAIDPSMPGTFLVRTITGTMHIVVNDPAGESVVRRVRLQATSEFVGDSDWLPVEYRDIRVGDDASFRIVRSQVYGEAPAFVDKYRRTLRVTQIVLYDGYPPLPDSDIFGIPRALPTEPREEPS